jgi:hypothetical protein
MEVHFVEASEARPILPRIGMYSAKGANPAPLRAVLVEWGFPVNDIAAADLPQLAEAGIDVLYLPGGWYFFTDIRREAIRQFVRAGGGCVGTCAGSYRMVDGLGLITGRVLRMNMRGRLYLEPQDGQHDILAGVVQRCTRHDQRRWEPIAVTQLGGPVILPEDRTGVIASYDVEGELGAIVVADFGDGRAVVIASHPERPLVASPYDDADAPAPPPCQGDERLIVRNAVLWATKRKQ